MMQTPHYILVALSPALIVIVSCLANLTQEELHAALLTQLTLLLSSGS